MRRNEVLRQLFRSGSGRVGAVMLVTMVVISLYVLVAFPRDFGSRIWSNPAEWADFPKAVPPAWMNLLSSDDKPPHVILEMGEPVSETPAGPSVVRQYRSQLTHTSSEAPSFVSLSFSEVTYVERPPQYTLSILRPDGQEMVLFRHVVRGPRPGEEAPYSRYQDTAFRVLLSGESSVASAVADFYENATGVRPSDAGEPGFVQRAVFGAPANEELSTFSPLHGTYEVRLRVVSGPEDSIGPSRFVAGGTVFGIMGTDSQGRDLVQGLMFGVPVALFIGIGAALLTTLLGATLGIASGYMGGWVDTLIQRAADVVANIPVLPLLIFLVFVVGSQLYLIILVLVAFSWPGLTILLRSMVLQIRSGQLVEAAVTLGASPWRIMARHIFPQTAPYVFAQLVFLVPGAILAEAALSFLGLGDPSIPTWGQILEQGFRTGGVYVGYWWWVIPPGLLIILTAITFILLALGMEQVTNPRLRNTLS